MNRAAPTAHAARLLARGARGLLAALVLAALVAGVPWTLISGVGWPLPKHLPTLGDIGSVLMAPMSTRFLLDTLSCVSWLVWLRFVLDVAGCAVEAARGTGLPDLARRSGPLRRSAAMLVGALLVALLSRPATAAPAPAHLPGRTPETTTTLSTTPAVTNTNPASRLTTMRAEQVQPPKSGVHDSLWRIAQRRLGDGARWPEIWALNHHSAQPAGRVLTNPALIHPGDTLRLPATSPPPAPRAEPHPAPTLTVPAPTREPAPPATTTPAPARTETDSPGEAGGAWGSEVFVGLGLTAAVSVAVMVSRRRHRRRYQPGSGERGDLPLAPVVYQLRLAHLSSSGDSPNTEDEDEADLNRTSIDAAEGSGDQGVVVPVGVRHGREVAVDLAAVHGVGLLGAGAPAAIRALLVTILGAAFATTCPSGTVIVPRDDLAVVLGTHTDAAVFPSTVRVVADLDAALDMLESDILVRAGQHLSVSVPRGPMVLVARVPTHQARRLQAVLDNGSAVGVSGLLLGQWKPGVTAYVRAEGIVSATSPGPGEPLRGTQMFRLGEDHLADLLVLLRHAEPDDEPDLTGTAHGTPTPPPPTSADKPVGASSDFAGHGGGAVVFPAATTDPVVPTTRTRELEILGAAGAPSPGLRPHVRHPRHPPAQDQQGPAASEDHQGDRPAAGGPPVRISVLGPPRVWWRAAPAPCRDEADEVTEQTITEQEITAAFQPRLRELLTFLALHPDGATREALIGAVWATSPPEKITNAMNTALSRLRRALTTATNGTVPELLMTGEGRYRLDPDLVDVDYHHFAAATTARRAATTDTGRVEAYRRIVDTYTGPLADGLSTDWIETTREAIRRDAIDAVAALARALVHDDPQQTLDLLEAARAFDPHNEAIYRDIMRLQERLGRLDAIPRTLTLLTTRLAEIGDKPTQHATDLADRLRRRHEIPNETRQASRGFSRTE